MRKSIRLKSQVATVMGLRGIDSQVMPLLPPSDNEPGAPEALMNANVWWRNHAWPSPYNETSQAVHVGDARNLNWIPNESVHLVVTSPPYFNLKPYASDAAGAQLGRIAEYESFLLELDKVWKECFRVLVPGGRVCCVVGDILVPRKSGGRHFVLPLPSDIQVRTRAIGLDNLTPIFWFKIGNRTNESGGGSSGFYGKPYQPGAVIKNDHEHILMLRKPGGYRTTDMIQKALSMLLPHEMDAWMRPVWSDIRGASLRGGHPAPYPVEMAERLIRMFSFAGDTILDPFAGSGSTAIAATKCGRSSVSVEVEPIYAGMALGKVIQAARSAHPWGPRHIEVVDGLATSGASGASSPRAIHVLSKPKLQSGARKVTLEEPAE
jgi:DNA modification methylase